jgi:hypothetical protein
MLYLTMIQKNVPNYNIGLVIIQRNKEIDYNDQHTINNSPGNHLPFELLFSKYKSKVYAAAFIIISVLHAVLHIKGTIKQHSHV